MRAPHPYQRQMEVSSRHVLRCARERIRTFTPLWAAELEPAASSVPPRGLILLCGAQGESRTRTPQGQLVLSQPCLPFHHLSKVPETGVEPAKSSA